MAANSTSSADPDSEELDALVDSLSRQIGRVVTVFTTSGGCSGRGFTGLLVDVDCNKITLSTALPSAPRHPFGVQAVDPAFRYCPHASRMGTSVVIPVSKICSCAFATI